MATRVRDSSWENDVILSEKLKEYVAQGLRNTKLFEAGFSRIRLELRRMSYFNVNRFNYDISVADFEDRFSNKQFLPTTMI